MKVKGKVLDVREVFRKASHRQRGFLFEDVASSSFIM